MHIQWNEKYILRCHLSWLDFLEGKSSLLIFAVLRKIFGHTLRWRAIGNHAKQLVVPVYFDPITLDWVLVCYFSHSDQIIRHSLSTRDHIHPLPKPHRYHFKRRRAVYMSPCTLNRANTNYEWIVFTWSQFWPSGNFVACVCVCVCLSVCQSLVVRAITRDLFKLGSPNLVQGRKRPWLRSLLFCGLIDLDLEGQI